MSASRAALSPHTTDTGQVALYGATITWHLGPDTPFSTSSYNRDHEWTFPGGEVVSASASPHYLGAASRVSPEEALIASLSSCHMLTFLALAANKGLHVLSYLDRASGVLAPNAAGQVAITEIALRPRVVFDDDAMPDDTLRALHQQTHEQCFIANSLTARIVVEPDFARR
ncbi:OsmC family protein [Alcanivorax quisquiliarum]|uniref:OsmC family protein n=1 Tax=Alcanivorax quisquiliarum TaxID=2933565 RepID=A0ABT0E531_9GAMM|nr:OsmC family protein [Alcanivorax quisquiliarum]MCK0536931.1 OsmC family protein [Alcanivorax quisquiliarum]